MCVNVTGSHSGPCEPPLLRIKRDPGEFGPYHSHLAVITTINVRLNDSRVITLIGIVAYPDHNMLDITFVCRAWERSIGCCGRAVRGGSNGKKKKKDKLASKWRKTIGSEISDIRKAEIEMVSPFAWAATLVCFLTVEPVEQLITSEEV